MIVVSDASPVRYLVLIEAIDVLPTLFGQVFLPPAVLRELIQPQTPLTVREWAESPPAWLRVRTPTEAESTLDLDAGEAEAILLAQELKAERLLMDDKKGRLVAVRRGLSVAGTLTVLAQAADLKLLDLRQAVDRLRQTNFRAPAGLLSHLLDRNSKQSARTIE